MSFLLQKLNNKKLQRTKGTFRKEVLEIQKRKNGVYHTLRFVYVLLNSITAEENEIRSMNATIEMGRFRFP